MAADDERSFYADMSTVALFLTVQRPPDNPPTLVESLSEASVVTIDTGSEMGPYRFVRLPKQGRRPLPELAEK